MIIKIHSQIYLFKDALSINILNLKKGFLYIYLFFQLVLMIETKTQIFPDMSCLNKGKLTS